MFYFDEDDASFETLLDAIRTDSCVLFLGPLFGIDQNNHRINDLLRDNLIQNKFSLDSDYQNLFLITNKSSSEYTMSILMRKFYDGVKFSSSYENIAKIKFASIITFTQDNFLNKAFESSNYKFRFDYFCVKGKKKEIEDNADSLPFIYNVYGDYKDVNSLIMNYDTFHTFLSTILGNSKIFPPQLDTIITKASVLLFLGFDLKHWSVPLIVTRIYNIGKAEKTIKPDAIASLNNTNKTNLAYMDWLSRYPLDLKFVKSTNSFITKILNTADSSLFRTPSPSSSISSSPLNDNWKNDSEFLKNQALWINQISASTDTDLLAVFEKMIEFFMYKNFRLPTNYLTNQKRALNGLIFQEKRTRKDISVETNTIVSDVLDFIN